VILVCYIEPHRGAPAAGELPEPGIRRCRRCGKLRRALGRHVPRHRRICRPCSHGAKPADLLAQRPTTYELVVNLKTAKTLVIALPQRFLVTCVAPFEVRSVPMPAKSACRHRTRSVAMN
jgi:hypothetical protein